jgi:hypothetical protein
MKFLRASILPPRSFAKRLLGLSGVRHKNSGTKDVQDNIVPRRGVVFLERQFDHPLWSSAMPYTPNHRREVKKKIIDSARR